MLSFYWLLFSLTVHAQDSLSIGDLTIPVVPFSQTFDPTNLVNFLTEGNTSDKEKFDALFIWVATNIRYDSRLFNSGKASSSESNVKRILRRKRGICIDYANLMDTLCQLAGLESEVINGYTKDILFDVNDTLYLDNHVWNGVKLNGYWYVYDVTWSAGKRYYDYSPRAKRRLKRVEKLHAKAKLEEVILTKKDKGDKFCGIPASEITDTVLMHSIPIIPLIRIIINEWFAFRVVEVENRVTNLNYYLTLPEKMAVDHFPVDPTWSLVVNPSNVFEYSADSTYYYRTRHFNDTTKRLGQKCLDCDAFLSLKEVKKEKAIISINLQNNSKNHLVPGNANLAISSYFYRDVLNEEDSLTKMALIDSVLFYLKETRGEYQQTKINSRQEKKFHKAKNRDKRNFSVKENKTHLSKAKKAFQNIVKRHIKIKSLDRKAESNRRSNTQYLRSFIRTIDKKRNSKKLKPEKIESLQSNLSEMNEKVDSLNNRISLTRDSLLENMRTLWGNLAIELGYINPVVSNFYRDGNLRVLGSKDAYDLEIRQLRKGIETQEALFLSTVDTLVLQLSDTVYVQYMELNRMIKRRNVEWNKTAKLYSTLRAAGVIPYEVIEQKIVEKKERTREDECWSGDQQDIFKSIQRNFSFLYGQHKSYYRSINRSNQMELKRYERINKYIELNYRRANSAVTQNLKTANRLKKEMYKHRKEYLKKVKKLRG